MINEKLKAGNVINLDLDTPIYKYIPFKYLKIDDSKFKLIFWES